MIRFLRSAQPPILFMMLLVLFPAAVAQPTSVNVQLRIQDPSYIGEFGRTEVGRAEAVLQKLAIAELQSRIGFLRFTSDPQPNRIVIDLGSADRQPGEPINFHLRASPGANKDLSWTFRSGADAVSGLSKKHSVEEKLQDVDLVGDASGSQPGEFRQKFSRVGLTSLVSALRALPVTSKGEMPEGPPDPLWELPLNRAETCMDLNSRLAIDHRLSRETGQSEKVHLEVEAIGPDGSTSDAMNGHIQARVPAIPDQKVLIQRLGNPNVKKVEVEGVYVLDYHPTDCRAVVAPTESGLAAGGPQ